MTGSGIFLNEGLRSSLWVVHAFYLYETFHMSALVKSTGWLYLAPCTRIRVALPTLIAQMPASTVRVLRQLRGPCAQDPISESGAYDNQAARCPSLGLT